MSMIVENVIRHVGAAWGEEHGATCERCEEEPVAFVHRTPFGILGFCEECEPHAFE